MTLFKNRLTFYGRKYLKSARPFCTDFINQWPDIVQTFPGFSPVQCCLEHLAKDCMELFLCSVVPGVLRQHCTRFFPVQYCLEPLGQHCIGFDLCNVVPRAQEYKDSSEQDFFPVHCCLEPRGQHCINSAVLKQHWTGFSPVLIGNSRATLHWVFVCAILSEEYLLGQHCTGKTLRSVILEAPDNIA